MPIISSKAIVLFQYQSLVSFNDEKMDILFKLMDIIIVFLGFSFGLNLSCKLLVDYPGHHPHLKKLPCPLPFSATQALIDG